MDAAFAGGPGEHAEKLAGQADVAPARGDRDGDVRGAVLFGWLVAGDRDTALAGGFDGDEREPARVVDGRKVIEEFGRDPRVAAEEPAADGVGVGGPDRFGQRGRVTGLYGADEDAAPIAQVPFSAKSEASACDSDSGALDLYQFSDAPIFAKLNLFRSEVERGAR